MSEPRYCETCRKKDAKDPFLCELCYDKSPRLMKDVYAQIDQHPRLIDTDYATLYTYQFNKEGNDIWCRRLWSKLYIDWRIEL